MLAGTAGTAALSLAYVVERKLDRATMDSLTTTTRSSPADRRVDHAPAARDGVRKLVTLEDPRWSYGSAFGLWHGILRRKAGEPWATAIFGGTLMTADLPAFPLLQDALLRRGSRRPT